MKLPTFDALIPEQLKIYEHSPLDPLFVVGPPGSGKTTLAVYRAKYLSDLKQSVLVVTRNRMLAALARHLSDDLVSTTSMHTLVSTDYCRRFKQFVPQTGPFNWHWDQILDAYRGVKLDVVDHIIVDEGQNLPPEFFAWSFLYGRYLTVFADENQATCEHTSSLTDIATNGRLPTTPWRLQTNHRNTPEISAFAEYFHRSKSLPPAIPVKPRGGARPRLVSIDSLDSLADRVARRFKGRGESIGVIVAYKSDATALLAKISARLDVGTRVDCYTSDAKSGTETSIKTLDPGVTILTSESAIGLEFDTVYLACLDTDKCLPCNSEEKCRRMYMLSARARTTLILVDGISSPLAPKQKNSLPDETLMER